MVRLVLVFQSAQDFVDFVERVLKPQAERFGLELTLRQKQLLPPSRA